MSSPRKHAHVVDNEDDGTDIVDVSLVQSVSPIRPASSRELLQLPATNSPPPPPGAGGSFIDRESIPSRHRAVITRREEGEEERHSQRQRRPDGQAVGGNDEDSPDDDDDMMMFSAGGGVNSPANGGGSHSALVEARIAKQLALDCFSLLKKIVGGARGFGDVTGAAEWVNLEVASGGDPAATRSADAPSDGLTSPPMSPVRRATQRNIELMRMRDSELENALRSSFAGATAGALLHRQAADAAPSGGDAVNLTDAASWVAPVQALAQELDEVAGYLQDSVEASHRALTLQFAEFKEKLDEANRTARTFATDASSLVESKVRDASLSTLSLAAAALQDRVAAGNRERDVMLTHINQHWSAALESLEGRLGALVRDSKADADRLLEINRREVADRLDRFINEQASRLTSTTVHDVVSLLSHAWDPEGPASAVTVRIPYCVGRPPLPHENDNDDALRGRTHLDDAPRGRTHLDDPPTTLRDVWQSLRAQMLLEVESKWTAAVTDVHERWSRSAALSTDELKALIRQSSLDQAQRCDRESTEVRRSVSDSPNQIDDAMKGIATTLRNQMAEEAARTRHEVTTLIDGRLADAQSASTASSVALEAKLAENTAAIWQRVAKMDNEFVSHQSTTSSLVSSSAQAARVRCQETCDQAVTACASRFEAQLSAVQAEVINRSRAEQSHATDDTRTRLEGVTADSRRYADAIADRVECDWTSRLDAAVNSAHAKAVMDSARALKETGSAMDERVVRQQRETLVEVEKLLAARLAATTRSMVDEACQRMDVRQRRDAMAVKEFLLFSSASGGANLSGALAAPIPARETSGGGGRLPRGQWAHLKRRFCQWWMIVGVPRRSARIHHLAGILRRWRSRYHAMRQHQLAVELTNRVTLAVLDVTLRDVNTTLEGATASLDSLVEERFETLFDDVHGVVSGAVGGRSRLIDRILIELDHRREESREHQAARLLPSVSSHEATIRHLRNSVVPPRSGLNEGVPPDPRNPLDVVAAMLHGWATGGKVTSSSKRGGGGLPQSMTPDTSNVSLMLGGVSHTVASHSRMAATAAASSRAGTPSKRFITATPLRPEWSERGGGDDQSGGGSAAIHHGAGDRGALMAAAGPTVNSISFLARDLAATVCAASDRIHDFCALVARRHRQARLASESHAPQLRSQLRPAARCTDAGSHNWSSRQETAHHYDADASNVMSPPQAALQLRDEEVLLCAALCSVQRCLVALPWLLASVAGPA